MKKFLSIILSLVVLFSVCGCSDKNNSAKNDDSQNLETIRIAKTAYHIDTDAWNGDGEYAEAIRTMLAEIEGEENIQIKVDYYSPTEFGKLAQTAITNGDTSFADIMIMPLFTFGPLYAQGLLMDTSELTGLDINSDVWSKSFTDIATFAGKTYGIASPGLLLSGQGGTGMIYNKTLADSLGLEDPVQLARDGKWTWDKLRELSLKAAKDLNNDGVFTEDDRFGCTCDSWDAMMQVFFTAGVPTMVKQDDGRIVYNLLSEEANTVAQKLHSTFTQSDGMFYGGGYDAIKQSAQFVAGKSVFHIGGILQEAGETTDEIMALPLPKYKESDEYVSTAWHNHNILSVPISAERKELIGRVIQMLGDKSKDFVQYSLNDSSLDYVDRDTFIEMNNLVKNFTVDPCTIMVNSNDDIANGTMRAVGTAIINPDVTFAQLTQSKASVIQSVLDDMFNPK